MTPRINCILGALLLVVCDSPGDLSLARAEEATAEPPAAVGAFLDDAPEPGQPGPRCYRERFAVCIGINRYEQDSGFEPLSHAANDAVELAEVLANVCDFEHILLMCDTPLLEELKRRSETWVNKKEEKKEIVIVPDVTYDSIHHRVYEFLKNSRCPDNVVLFFFSGHGESPPNNAAFLGRRITRSGPI